ncbi:SulP family inorganic anion transporter [Phenylobacterium aquaticum]|uniref:SulP family inorganic anion transporter n=1 Tax=Phenylobacterium aquaticum TaxID=1763816 RepID=UPI0026E9E170|nr:SulP family inorganic anion transporter [Phenylobacterium aquaticum]
MRTRYEPKLLTVFREGYALKDLRADAVAGLTVAIVALPLSMAIAIASGVSPDRGLFTAIVGGFLVSLLGGSRYQIGGPAGAFIVLVATTVTAHGLDGLLLATLMSGLMLAGLGLLRAGTFIRYMPYPVTVGFTGAIAVIIGASQLKDLLGLRLTGPEPGPLIPKLAALFHALPSANPMAIAVAAGVIAVILTVKRFRPLWPGMLIAIVAASVIAWGLHLPVETIGARFGRLAQGLEAPRLPPVSWAKVQAVLPAALSFTLLGAIESLLSAVVADSMTGRRHRPDTELIAQGIANIGSALFGGIVVTGTIARTATNVRSGARGPLAGMLHAVFLLGFMVLAAPLAAYIPLAALAGLLAVVAWNMAEKHEFATLIRTSKADAAVLLTTFGLTLARDLSTGIIAGFSLGALLFIHRMATAVDVRDTDRDDEEPEGFTPALTVDRDIATLKISGAFFFGATAQVGATLDEIGARPKGYILDLSGVQLMDSSGAAAVASFARNAARRGAKVFLAGAAKPVRRALMLQGLRPPLVRYRSDVQAAARALGRGGDCGLA